MSSDKNYFLSAALDFFWKIQPSLLFRGKFMYFLPQDICETEHERKCKY